MSLHVFNSAVISELETGLLSFTCFFFFFFLTGLLINTQVLATRNWTLVNLRRKQDICPNYITHCFRPQSQVI